MDRCPPKLDYLLRDFSTKQQIFEYLRQGSLSFLHSRHTWATLNELEPALDPKPYPAWIDRFGPSD